MMLSRDDILKAEDLKPEEVDVPEWGGSVLVQGMTGTQRDKYERSMVVEQINSSGAPEVIGTDMSNLRAKLVAACVVDENGDPLFHETDVQALGKKSALALDRVHEVAARLSGMTGEAEKAIEANLGDTPAEPSTSE